MGLIQDSKLKENIMAQGCSSRLGIVDPLALTAEIDFRVGSATLDPLEPNSTCLQF